MGGGGATGTQGGSAVLAEVLTDQAGGGEQAWEGGKEPAGGNPFLLKEALGEALEGERLNRRKERR